MAKRTNTNEPTRKPLVWLEGEVKTPPFTAEGRIEAGTLLRLLQEDCCWTSCGCCLVFSLSLDPNSKFGIAIGYHNCRLG